jgi:hypothetical protein
MHPFHQSLPPRGGFVGSLAGLEWAQTPPPQLSRVVNSRHLKHHD